MYRIRLHGRGGQGIKTAGRILGSAFFAEGFEVQDAPRYGAERRGAPIFATVRAAHAPIHERGLVQRPDLVVVADATLVPVAAAGVLQGVHPATVLLVNSVEGADTWRERLRVAGPIAIVPAEAEDRSEVRFIGAICAAAAARLLGVIRWEALEQALHEELSGLSPAILDENLRKAREAFDALSPQAGCVVEGKTHSAAGYTAPEWVVLGSEEARIAAPDVRAAASSTQVRTGLWRTMRPVIDHERCHRCTWICGTFCPDGALGPDDAGWPRIDYDHCKGCLVCVAVCPSHAIRAVPEVEARAEEGRS